MRLDRGNFESNLDFLEKTKVLNKNKKILEIGSGTGHLVSYLQNKDYKVTGSDISEENIEIAKKKFGVKLKKINGENLPFSNNFYDVVMSFDVFEHIPDSGKHLKEVNRVLKNEGSYLIQTPNQLTNVPFSIIKNKSFTKHKKAHCSLHTYWGIKKGLPGIILG